MVGKPASFIAEQAGITAPAGTRVLIAELAGVGRDYPLSIEKLCPVLSYYVVADWREGCERCIQILRYGGMGHTMSIHSQDDKVILEFGLKKPAFRIVVNTPTTHGSIGLTTGLDPAMTLGCGGPGGNITSDNISPRHLLNIKRLAYELRPARASAPAGAPALPRREPDAPAPGIAAADMARQVSSMLGSHAPLPSGTNPSAGAVVEFVCEDDVRQAIRLGRKIVIGERTIVTPAARISPTRIGVRRRRGPRPEGDPTWASSCTMPRAFPDMINTPRVIAAMGIGPWPVPRGSRRCIADAAACAGGSASGHLTGAGRARSRRQK
jgi:acetaldehyde dehydrogenase (acetylating)